MIEIFTVWKKGWIILIHDSWSQITTKESGLRYTLPYSELQAPCNMHELPPAAPVLITIYLQGEQQFSKLEGEHYTYCNIASRYQDMEYPLCRWSHILPNHNTVVWIITLLAFALFGLRLPMHQSSPLSNGSKVNCSIGLILSSFIFCTSLANTASGAAVLSIQFAFIETTTPPPTLR